MSNVKKEDIDCNWCLRNLSEICGHDVESVKITDSDPGDLISLDDAPVTYKTDASLKDQQSTGRKRAAQLYPLNPEAYCEWSGKTKQGGGPHPIDGCGIRSGTNIGLQQARHHGPDKNTLNNESGNVHRICTPCHNEWHAKNDKDYIPGKVMAD